MSTAIRANIQYLTELQQAMSSTVTALGSGATVVGCDLSRSGEVHQEWSTLSKRWDDNRTKLSGNLDALVTAIGVIIEAFEGCDTELGASLSSPA